MELEESLSLLLSVNSMAPTVCHFCDFMSDAGQKRHTALIHDRNIHPIWKVVALWRHVFNTSLIPIMYRYHMKIKLSLYHTSLTVKGCFRCDCWIKSDCTPSLGFRFIFLQGSILPKYPHGAEQGMILMTIYVSISGWEE